MQCGADDGRELRHVGDGEVHREGSPHRCKYLADRGYLREVPGKHHIVEVTASRREDREHRYRLGDHIYDAEGYVVFVGKVGKVSEVRRGEVCLYVGIYLGI